MQLHREGAILQALPQLGGRAHHLGRTRGLGFQPKEPRHRAHGLTLRVVQGHRRGQAIRIGVATRHPRRYRGRVVGIGVGRRRRRRHVCHDLRIADEDGEESAAEASLPGARQIEVPLVGALEEGATGERQIEQRVVVTVEDRDAGGDGHGSRTFGTDRGHGTRNLLIGSAGRGAGMMHHVGGESAARRGPGGNEL